MTARPPDVHPLVRLGDEVADALAEGRAVVALESSVIAQGLPAPHNVTTALRVEQAVRAAGAVPATVAIAGGRIHVGADGALVERLGEGTGVAKASRRDLAAVVAGGGLAATTVSTTMIAAALAGIEVFATGGIGGVHRGAAETWDVSADLDELARTPVTVVCAGAKLILDLPRTMEALETRGVPVIGFGTDRLPAFFVRESDEPVAARVDDVDELAALVRVQRALRLGGGVLVTQPCPAGAAVPRADAERWIAEALAEAATKGVTGKQVTPFLLGRVAALSGGATMAANIALLLANATLAAQLATTLAGPAPATGC